MEDPESQMMMYRVKVGSAPGKDDIVADHVQPARDMFLNVTGLHLPAGSVSYLTVVGYNNANGTQTFFGKGIVVDNTPPNTTYSFRVPVQATGIWPVPPANRSRLEALHRLLDASHDAQSLTAPQNERDPILYMGGGDERNSILADESLLQAHLDRMVRPTMTNAERIFDRTMNPVSGGTTGRKPSASDASAEPTAFQRDSPEDSERVNVLDGSADMSSRAMRYGDSRPVAASLGAPSRRDLDWQDQTGALNGAWSPFEDLETGVWEYIVRIVDTDNGTVVSREKAVGFARSASIGPSAIGVLGSTSLSHGKQYAIEVCSENRAGLRSEWVRSDGVIIDTTPPSLGNITFMPDVVSRLKLYFEVEWDSLDAESGIAECLYSVGSIAGASDVQGWRRVAPLPDDPSPRAIPPAEI